MVKYILLFIAIFSQSLIFLYAETKATEDTSNASPVVEKELTKEEQAHIDMQAKIDEAAIKNVRNIKKGLINIVANVRKVSPSTADILERKILGIRIIQYLSSLLILFLTYAISKYILAFIFSFIEKLSKTKTTENFVTSFIARIRRPMNMLEWVVGIYFALAFLLREPALIALVSRAVAILFWGAIFWCSLIFSDVAFETVARKLKAKSAKSMANLFSFLNRVVKIFIIVIAVLFVLNNCGVNVNTIVASLGIGGMALAFASQDTIANFFGSVSIIIDRPFIVGDWVKTKDCEGIVEAIGFRSTRVRTFTKTVVTIPNSILAKEAIENFAKMPVRRSKQILGLTYSTTADQMEAFLPELRDTVLSIDGVVKSLDVSVEFINFGSSSLDIELIFFTKETGAGYYKGTVRNVNIAIMRLVEKRGLSFAFPSLSLYVEKNESK